MLLDILILLFLTDIGWTVADNKPRAAPHFRDAIVIGHVTTHEVEEASGLAASRLHPGVLYTVNDSGGKKHVMALDANTGKRLATFVISGAVNFDWEDIACGPCGGVTGHCIYIADTGDKRLLGAANRIYRVREPASMTDQHLLLDSTLKFTWHEPDAETLLVDPRGEIYLISKVHGGAGAIAHLPSSAWGAANAAPLTILGYLTLTTSHPDPVGGDISPDGTEILVKTHKHIYYWKLTDGDYPRALTMAGVKVPYHKERKGESVCWSISGNGYYSLSEGKNEPLYFYQRV